MFGSLGISESSRKCRSSGKSERPKYLIHEFLGNLQFLYGLIVGYTPHYFARGGQIRVFPKS